MINDDIVGTFYFYENLELTLVSIKKCLENIFSYIKYKKKFI